MKIIKRMFVLITFFFLSFGTTILAQAASIEGDLNVIQNSTITGSCGNDLTWSLANGNLMITGVGSMTNYTKEEETPWYSYASDINTVTIGSGVTSIGGHAFYNFDYLTTVNISDTVTDIRGYAFSDCDSLVKIVMPDSVTTMGGYVFEGCDYLSEVKLSNGLTVIPGFTFNQCKRLSVVNIPARCTAINGRAFAECSALENISFPSALKEIGENAFFNCSKLKNVSFPPSLINIGYGAFSNCKSITAITIPDTIECIGSRAFKECEKLTSVKFEGSLPKMQSMSFFKCTQINAVYVDSMDDWVKAYFEDRFSNPLFYSNKLYINGTSIGTTLIIPEGVKELPANVFAGSDITKVVLPDTVEKIGEECFFKCVNLSSVDMSSSLYYIREGAFANCKKLTSITFPASMKYISEQAFYNCSSLKKVFFEGKAPSITKVYFVQVGPGAADGAHSLSGAFAKCTFTAYYPQSDATWTKDVREENYGGEITWIGYESSLTIPAKPYKIVNTVSGVHIYWNAVSGVSKYGLWRSETGKEGSYKWLGNPTTNHFTDTKVTGGKTYFYCVSTCNPNSNAHSVMSEPIGITYVETPDITVRMNLAAGVKLTWNQVDGATGYAIYRKSYDGGDSWARIATIEGNSTFTYTDTSVATANGKVYRYTIRALAGSNMKTLSGCRNMGRTMTRLTDREVSNVTAVDAISAKCTWTTTVQAAGYEVMFVSENGDVTIFTVGNYKTGVKTFKGLESKTTYTVQVRSYKAVAGVGTFYSAWSEEKSVTTP